MPRGYCWLLRSTPSGAVFAHIYDERCGTGGGLWGARFASVKVTGATAETALRTALLELSRRETA